MSEENKEESGFKVTDKRHFTPDGEIIPGGAEETPSREEAPPPPPPQAEPEKAPPPPPPEGSPAAEAEPGPGAPPGPLDFTHLLMSLAGTAYHALGIADPASGEKGVVNLPAASQMIDLLGILEEKTQGNLNEQEEKILQSVLTELRSLFIQTSGFAGKEPPPGA